MRRTLFHAEHDTLREMVRAWAQERLVPHHDRWRQQGQVDRSVWLEAGELGLLCPWMSPEWGGVGGDFLHSVVIMEELARAYDSGFGLGAPLHSDIVVPYIHDYGSDILKGQVLPRCASGEIVTAIAMTEPDVGSDLSALRTRATRREDGWVLHGSKTFISNGQTADLVVVAARTGGPDVDRHQALSLFAVEADRPGFTRGRRLSKMGLHAQDTSELHLDGVVVPPTHLLGAEGSGFFMLMDKLAQERLVVAIGAQATAERVLEDTLAWCQERQAFGRPIARFQNTRFKLAECATEIEVGRAFLDRVIAAHLEGEDLVKEASMCKWWHTEMLQRVCDTCLQLFGGYGYMSEYPISHAFVDARVQRIYAGTNEIMKVIIAQRLGL